MMRRFLYLATLAFLLILSLSLTAANGSGMPEWFDSFFQSFERATVQGVSAPQKAEIIRPVTDHGWRLASRMTDSGDLTGVAVDPDLSTPIAGVDAEIAFLDGTVVDTQATDSLGKFTFANLTDDEYKITLSYPGYKDTWIWTGIVDDQVTQLPEGKMIMEPIVHHGTASGTVTDAVSGDLESGVQLEFRAGIYPPDTEPILYTTTSNWLGTYTLTNGLAGVYTATLSKTAFEDAQCIVYVIGSKTIAAQNCVISPQLSDDEVRIILTWGASPSDLDSHLWTPSYPCATSGFHLYFSTRGSHACTAYFDLDLDDVTSYGPETTTIYQTTSGTYRFLVQDYTNRSCTGSSCTTMSNSGAQVSVVTSTQTFNFYITPGVSATVWRVLEIDGLSQTINYLDQYAFQSTPSSVY